MLVIPWHPVSAKEQESVLEEDNGSTVDDPRNTQLHTYLSLNSLFLHHRFPWKPGKSKVCACVCVSVCACTRNREQEREFAGKKLLAPYRAHSIFNTWLFPLKFKHGVIFNDKRMLEVKGCNYSGVKFRGKLMWGHIAMQQSNVLWKVAKQ